MRKTALFLAATFLFGTVPAFAQLKVLGSGDNIALDVSGFPPKMKQAYSLMSQKCTRCHTMERIIVSVQSGVCPITKMEFSKETIRNLVTRMYLKPESGLSRRDALTVAHFLNYLIDIQAGVEPEEK